MNLRVRNISIRKLSSRAIATLAAIIAALFACLPLLWALFSSLRPQSEIFTSLTELSWNTLIPEIWTFDNYISLFQGAFLRALVNSLIVTSITVILAVAISAFSAFAFSVLRFRFREALFGIIVISFLIPFEGITVPLSQVLRDLGLQNTYTGLILPGLGVGMAIFLLRQFFLNVPHELHEAARLDGLGWFGVLRRIYIPIAKPSIIGASLIVFNFQWQSYIWPLLIAPNPSMRVAPVAVAEYMGETGTDFGEMFAAAITTSILPLIIFIFFQRQFTESLAGAHDR